MINLSIIHCTNPRCGKEYKKYSVTLYSGFSCPNCGWEKYNVTTLKLPKKRKDKIKLLENYNEKYN